MAGLTAVVTVGPGTVGEAGEGRTDTRLALEEQTEGTADILPSLVREAGAVASTSLTSTWTISSSLPGPGGQVSASTEGAEEEFLSRLLELLATAREKVMEQEVEDQLRKVWRSWRLFSDIMNTNTAAISIYFSW